MKKIMFNDKYRLTQAVLEGRKTMTRRIVSFKLILKYGHNKFNDRSLELIKCAPFKIGEIVAVAQSYETLANSGCDQLDKMLLTSSTFKKEYIGTGWNNKMFVKADYMPHQIQITDIKVERLQDISDDDCFKEGIDSYSNERAFHATQYDFPNSELTYLSPRMAFAELIDKVSGKGTWESNPFVYAYSFELVK